MISPGCNVDNLV